MSLIKIDKEMLINTVYHVRSKVDIEVESNQELIQALAQLVELIQNAPSAEVKSQFPRIRRGRM